jgi:hypothetical protein
MSRVVDSRITAQRELGSQSRRGGTRGRPQSVARQGEGHGFHRGLRAGHGVTGGTRALGRARGLLVRGAGSAGVPADQEPRRGWRASAPSRAVRTTNGGSRQGIGERARSEATRDGHGAVVAKHSVCLAAYVSGGLKSRSARGHGLISQSGGNASLAERRGRYGEVYPGTKAKAGDSQDGPGATSCCLSEDRVLPARGDLKGLRRTTGSYSMGAISERNRSAQAGEWSSLHYGGEGVVVPPQRTTVGAGDTVGKRQT